MKTMILAAGRGERMRPLTDQTPKPLLTAGGKALIEHIIDALVKAGLVEIVINHAYLGEQIPNKLGDGRYYGAKITYSDEGEQGLETAGGIAHALPLLGKLPFLVVNGDIWTDYPFEQLRHYSLSDTTDCHLVLTDNPVHHSQGDFTLQATGHLSVQDSFRKTYTGIGLYKPRLFQTIPNNTRYPLKPVLLESIKKGTAMAEYYPGNWSDIGTPARLLQLDQQLSDKYSNKAF